MRTSVVQLAYVVDDLRASALERAEELGAGPFFLNPHMPVTVRHRNREAVLDHSAAFGQWGDVMIELIQYHRVEPSGLADALLPSSGIHHVAWFVGSLGAEQERLNAQGWPEVLTGEARAGVRFAFHQARALGHLVEIYETSSPLTDLYARVAQAADGWDGAGPIRAIGDLYRRTSTQRW